MVVVVAVVEVFMQTVFWPAARVGIRKYNVRDQTLECHTDRKCLEGGTYKTVLSAAPPSPPPPTLAPLRHHKCTYKMAEEMDMRLTNAQCSYQIRSGGREGIRTGGDTNRHYASARVAGDHTINRPHSPNPT